MIRLETELSETQKRLEKAESERDTLITAMDDLTEKANKVEKTCQELSKENSELMSKIQDMEHR